MPYRTEARIEPPNNGSRTCHALPHVASKWLIHWTTWAGHKLISACKRTKKWLLPTMKTTEKIKMQTKFDQYMHWENNVNDSCN